MWKRFLAALSMVSVLCCSGQWSSDPRLAPEKLEVAKACADLEDERLVREGSGLVQILLVGLMAFRHDKEAKTVHAYFPVDSKHKMRITYVKSKRLRWSRYIKKLGSGDKVTFDLGSAGVSLRSGADLGEYPESRDQARDADWMISESEIEGVDRELELPEKYVEVVFEAGVFETCGLVHDKHGAICEVNVGGYKGAASEYMVLRKEIDKNKKFRVLVNNRILKIKGKRWVPATNDGYDGSSVNYDLAIVNIDDRRSRRVLESSHGVHLEKMFKGAMGWGKFKATGCELDCQPKCIIRYWEFGPLFSGHDRPICPLVVDS